MQVDYKLKLSIPTREINVDTPNRYEILRNGLSRTTDEYILGRGSFGTVVKAIYKGKEVAVKILRTSNESQMQTIKNESNILGYQHRNIIEILKIDTTSTYSTIIMSEFEGKSLQILLDKITISLRHRICIILDCLNGLNYCHQNGILHLDVKPQNILVVYDQSSSPNRKNSNYVCKICDFGSSIKSTDNKIYENIRTQGTIRYMSPEMLKGENLTPESDIYSLGITMWQLKSNNYPYSSIDCNETVAYKVVKENYRPDSSEFELNVNFSDLTNNLVENIEIESFISPYKKQKHKLDINVCKDFRKSLFLSPSPVQNVKKLSKYSNNSLKNIPFSSFSVISPIKVQNFVTNKENQHLQIHRRKEKLNFDKNLQKFSIMNVDLIQKSPFKVPIFTNNDCKDENNIFNTENDFEFYLKSIFMDKCDKIYETFENQYENLYKICWHFDPHKRTSGHSLKIQLHKILKDIQNNLC